MIRDETGTGLSKRQATPSALPCRPRSSFHGEEHALLEAVRRSSHWCSFLMICVEVTFALQQQSQDFEILHPIQWYPTWGLFSSLYRLNNQNLYSCLLYIAEGKRKHSTAVGWRVYCPETDLATTESSVPVTDVPVRAWWKDQCNQLFVAFHPSPSLSMFHCWRLTCWRISSSVSEI